MATFEEENAVRNSLEQTLTKLSEIKAEQLGRENVLGQDLSFVNGIEYFRRTLKLFKDLKESSLDSVPYTSLQQLSTHAQQALERFKRIASFSIQTNPSNPVGARDGLINEIANSYDGAFQQVSPIIAYSVRKGTDFAKLERDAQENVKKLEELVSSQSASQRATSIEIQNTLEKVRRAAEEVGVAQHAIHFKSEATEYSSSARNWLVITAAFAGLTLLFGFGSLTFIVYRTPEFTPTQSIQLAIAKVIIFSVLLSATVWSGRTYRAARHNYVVNKHRQNALSTFETFVKAATDDATKSAVLLQATNCIFSSQQSGYISQEEAEAGGYPQILEIVRKATEGPGK